MDDSLKANRADNEKTSNNRNSKAGILAPLANDTRTAYTDVNQSTLTSRQSRAGNVKSITIEDVSNG